MRKFRLHLLVFYTLGMLALSWPSLVKAASPEHDAQGVRIGMLAFMGEALSTNTWASSIAQLQKTLPAYRFELKALNHDELAAAAARGELDFVLTNPGHYVELEAALGATRLLTLSGPFNNPSQGIGSAVVVPINSPLQRLEDLHGQRVALVGRQGFGGYQMLWHELALLNIEPERAFSAWVEVGFPMHKVFAAVLSGEADAGIVRTCLLESFAELKSSLRVLAPRDEPTFPCQTTSRLYPDWPLARLPDTPDVLSKAVAIELLSMPPTPEGVTWSVPVDYQSVHDMFRTLHIGPYAYLQPPTLTEVALRYWPAFMLVIGLLLMWLLYTLRVEGLVQQRTLDLQNALAEQHAAEARVRSHQEQADHLARLSILGELSGTLAHELNQPLATITNYARSLVRRSQASNLTADTTEQAAEEIAEQAERAAAILTRIRHFARKRAPQHELQSPEAVVAEAIALFRGLLSHAPPVTLHAELPATLRVRMDALQIQQVLLNLLKNSYDATRGLAPERHPIEVHLRLDNDNLLIAVRDLGPGLSPTVEARLFEAFLTTKTDGLGLGLSICKTIAEAHSGSLTATSNTPAPGMTFTLSLPHHA